MPATHCMLPADYCLLLSACHLLPASSCLLSAASSLLPSIYRRQPAYSLLPLEENSYIPLAVRTVRDPKGWVCNVALIKHTLGPGNPRGSWDFGREGTRGQWGTRGVSLRATWD
jgi:hypothetical protein